MRPSVSNVTAGSPRMRATGRQSVTLPVPTMRSTTSWRRPVRVETGGPCFDSAWAESSVKRELAQEGGGNNVGKSKEGALTAAGESDAQ